MDAETGSAIDCKNCGQPIEPRWSEFIKQFVWPWKCPHCGEHTLMKEN